MEDPVAVFESVDGAGLERRSVQGAPEEAGGSRGRVVLLALGLERARQFIKAFGERGGNLHVA